VVRTRLLDGTGLRQVFAWQDPFRVAAGDPVSLLGANGNFPAELQVKAFCLAAAHGPGSPLVVQFSHKALKAMGEIPGRREADALVTGAEVARFLLERYVGEAGGDHVAAGLDHFRVPPFPAVGAVPGDSRATRLARASVDDAREASRDVVSPGPESELEAYAAYLASPAYTEFKRTFLAVVAALRPAWAMIDTERFPPVLDFALTRDVIDLTRREASLRDTMLEAEYGATGVSGQARPYEALRGEDLARFAEEVARFVSYTGADGIAYPIGMEHGASSAERHEPDEDRLRGVQTRIIQVAGRYVPFAQHGGTGAARLVRGLVGKNNVNTRFLAAAANGLADRVVADVARIRAGVKEACGSGLYAGAVDAVCRATIEKLKETGSFGASPDLRVLVRTSHNFPIPSSIHKESGQG
jgi:fructose/tagatose bisphosphate aldolase